MSSGRVVADPDQYAEIIFSDPINSETDLRGLVLTDGEPANQIRVEYNVLKVYPQSRLSGMHNVLLNAAIESSHGYKLNKEVNYSLNFGGLKPNVRLLGEGVIVPQSKGLFFPFEAASLSAVDVRITKIFTNNIHAFLQNNDFNENYQISRVGRIIHRSKVDLTNKGVVDLGSWNAFNLDLSKLIDIEAGAIYNVQIGFRKEYSLFNCNSNENEPNEFVSITEEELYPNKSYYSVYYNYYYNWNEQNEPCKHAYFSPDKFVDRNILGSNFGIIAKVDQSGKTYVYITNLLTALPEQGVEVSFFDYQNQLMVTGTTDSKGMLSLQTEQNTFLLICKKDDKVAYLKLDNGTMLSTSNFDVSGRKVEKGIKGFLYGERDVWRPGDSIYVSFILEDKNQTLPKGHPLTLEVFNPKGQFVKKIVKSRDEKFIYPFFFKTNHEDQTGNWQIVLKAGAVSFSKTIRVETIKPNRLKVDLNFSDELLSAQRVTNGKLVSKWLHGSPANGLKAKVDVSFSSYAPTFSNLKDFDFSTPYNNFYGQEMTLFDNKLDERGEADLKFDFKPNNEVNGFLKAAFTTKVFEKGGDFSINYFAKPFSPYPDYVGLKIDWSYKNWNKLNNSEDHLINVATVDENGKPVNLKGVQVKLYELKYRWWYDSNNENLASYAGKTYHKPVFTSQINTVNGKGSFKIGQNEDRWGRHLLLVTSPNGHTTGQIIYFGWSWGRNPQKGGPQVLALITEKENFKVGEEVTVSFPANKSARALITFENGTGIIGQEWVDNLTDFSHYTFTAKPEMAPNIYVHVTLIQPHGQTANDLPIRLYGITPIMVEDPGTRLIPKLEIPREVRPLEEFTVNVSEENRKAMDYTIAIVDEGLLDITNFKTPDPWPNFYARDALGVKTYDLYKYVMGSFGSRLESMFAVGGSDNLNDNSKKKSERFKPVVKVLGPFHLKANSKGTHKITLPQYVGSVRAMVIAAEQGKYGNTEKTMPVREPLMVLATMPRVLSPGELVDLPVTIFAMKDNIRKVNVKIETNEYLKVQGLSDSIVTFEGMGEKDVFFKVKSAEKTGIAKLKVVVTSGNEKSFHEIELDIRQPNLPSIESEFKIVKSGEKWEANISKFGMDGSNFAQLEVSNMPPLNLGSRLNYLIRYPHGCIEQTTSSVFPQLYLPLLLELPSDQLEKISTNVEKGIERLQRFQTSDGGFSYWPGSTYSDSWGSCYAGYFLIEAEKAGYMVPGNMKSEWLRYMRKNASDFSSERSYRYVENTQAYRLYLLAMAGEPQISAMNRLRASTMLDNQTKWLLAGAYAISGMKEAAYKLMDLRNMKPDVSYSECYGSYLRDESMMLQTLIALKEFEHASKLAIEISEMLSTQSWYSTQSTAYGLVSLANFARATGLNKIKNFELLVNGKTKSFKNKNLFEVIDLEYDGKGDIQIQFKNSGEGSLFLNLSNEGVKPGVDTSQESKGLQLVVSYFDRQGNKLDPTQLKQGSDFIAKVSVYNKTLARVKNLALNQLFPAGWEIINSRLFGKESNNKNSTLDYQDIRDDRIYTYFELNGLETKSFTVHLNASYSGEYLLSPVSCEAMYDNSYFAKIPGMVVKVVKE